MGRLWEVLTRRKVIEQNNEGSASASGLARVLNTFDLTALGVGSTLGVGVYVLAGHVAKETAGPSVVLSFLIAAIASVFAGLCYAEFGARAPKAGSAYIYSYVCVGEFIAFVIGWNLILEYVIGSASVARGLTLYLDTLLNNTLKDTFIEIAPIEIEYMSSYFDFCSCGISLLLAVGLAFGVKESSIVNNIFTVINILVVLFVIIAGSFKADISNWEIPANTTTADIGDGGFFPFGVEGMIKGAATCFYGFIGFDCIATTGEEVKNPQRAIPLSIIFSLAIIFVAYFGVSTVVTLMVPYYLQDINAPIPHAFAEIGWDVAKWVVAIGGIFGLCASLFGAMFPLPRIIYAMASDGLVFRFLGKISNKFQTPVIGTLLAGVLTGLMAALFELKQLVNMMSIGTLLAYTIVASCVLLLRYAVDSEEYVLIRRYSSSSSEDETIYRDYDGGLSGTVEDSEDLYNTSLEDRFSCGGFVKQYFNCGRKQTPSKLTETLVVIQVTIYCILCLLFGLCIMYMMDDLLIGTIWAIVVTASVLGLMLVTILSIAFQPTSNKVLSFKVPLVPLIPALSIAVNIYLMLMLDVNTWIRFGVWMALGLLIYYLSVKAYSKPILERYKGNLARFSIPSIPVSPPPLKDIPNGYVNGGFYSEEIATSAIPEDDEVIEEMKIVKRRSKTPLRPSLLLLTATAPEPSVNSVDVVLDDLDDILAKELTRQYSVETVQNAYCEESVVALVHCEDPASQPEVPIPTPVNKSSKAKPSEAKNGMCIEIAIRSSCDSTRSMADSEIIFGENYNSPEITSNKPSLQHLESVESSTVVVTSDTEEEIPERQQEDTEENVLELKLEQEVSPDENINENELKIEDTENEDTSVQTKLPENDISPVSLDPQSKPEDTFTEEPFIPPVPPSFSEFELRKSLKSAPRLSLSILPDTQNDPSPEIQFIVKHGTLPHSFVPPPPSMDNFDKFLTMPRVESFKSSAKLPANIINQINKARKLRKSVAPDTPTPDYSREQSTIESDPFVNVEDVDDNIIFGSKQHDKIKQHLDRILKTKSTEISHMPKTALLRPMSYEVDRNSLAEPSANLAQLLSNIPVKKESIQDSSTRKDEREVNDKVEESKVAEVKKEAELNSPEEEEHVWSVSDIKNKLNSVFRNDPRTLPKRGQSEPITNSNLTMPRATSTISEKVVDKVEEKGDHAKLMRNTLNAINRRKVSDLRKTFTEDQT